MFIFPSWDIFIDAALPAQGHVAVYCTATKAFVTQSSPHFSLSHALLFNGM